MSLSITLMTRTLLLFTMMGQISMIRMSVHFAGVEALWSILFLIHFSLLRNQDPYFPGPGDIGESSQSLSAPPETESTGGPQGVNSTTVEEEEGEEEEEVREMFRDPWFFGEGAYRLVKRPKKSSVSESTPTHNTYANNTPSSTVSYVTSGGSDHWESRN